MSVKNLCSSKSLVVGDIATDHVRSVIYVLAAAHVESASPGLEKQESIMAQDATSSLIKIWFWKW